uniref:Uncharacterized protein n=1 Tax=Globodera rostochiensis TaxID=31243 RepID=A0A914I235_GLORO
MQLSNSSAIPVSITEKKQKSDSNRQNANAMSTSQDISISTTFIGGSAKTNRQMTPKKIEETIAAACATSIRAIGQNALIYGFLFNKIYSNTLNANVEGLINVIIASKDNPKYTSNSVINKILESADNSLIKEIMMEILAEDNEFGEKMKDNLKQNNLLTDQQKDMHFLFTYVRLFRKFSNALKWGSLGDWTKISADQPNNEQTIVFLQWLNRLNKGLEQNLITNVQHYSNATKWFEKLGRLENAIELTNFGILLILSPDTWEMFGVERPTKVKGLFEKIGKQKIIKQFDANSDLSSIEQTAQKTWITLDKMGNNVVLEKIKNIFIKMINPMKESNAVTLNIQNMPAKIILFDGILDQIYNELANSEFNQLYVPKLAEERANGLHFLEKCLEILNAEYESFEKGVQQELGDLAKLRKGYLECATSKTTNPRGKSAKDPISLD